MKVEDLRGIPWEINERLRKITHRGEIFEEKYESVVKGIINDVKNRGDQAVIEYTNRFDKVNVISAKELEIPREQLEEAYKNIPSDLRDALEFSSLRIRKFHEKQLEEGFISEEPEGIILGQKIVPLQKVGVYVPGGKAQYPSTVLMNVIPAKVAGVEEIVMVSPNPSQATLAAAYVAGVDKVFKIGGAQAVAALAYGTETLPKVDKIVGPGNIYVALAKKLLYGVVDIDMVAGPSEILVIADSNANPSWVAADLLSQAEHDELAGPFCVTDSLDLALKVRDEVDKQLVRLERREIAQKSVENWGTIFVVEDMEKACQLANLIAPEHLELFTENPWDFLPKIKNAGAIFLGRYTTEPLGDYVLGPNHTLPTGGTARFYSPLGVYDFVKRSSVLYVSKEGFNKVKEWAKIFASYEGLTAHKKAVEIRES
ncbi:MAG TPA: histidinol dehydrogenase [Aquifex aeolicus]|uniref:Histidinol dehydrogenase n=1 Tax=Aquifex aeolicus TaxID=63363 RepID=A0A9D0YPL8_AQUAO|nr:histidinol dehydrogenase [Aquifex aeolicus]HIQ25998.1 histidinol dehydrogenase [Aquifex aeolicus]